MLLNNFNVINFLLFFFLKKNKIFITMFFKCNCYKHTTHYNTSNLEILILHYKMECFILYENIK